MKTDKAILRIVSAAIKRHSVDYQSWQHTKLWGDLDNQAKRQFYNECNFEPKELPILAVFFDDKNWTLFSSRTLHYANEGVRAKALCKEIEEVKLGDFKGYLKPIEVMSIRLKDGTMHQVIHETGRPSMGAIYAVQTLQQVCCEG